MRESVGPFKALCQVAGAVGITLVQPGYDLLGRYPEFFVARKVETQEVVIAVAVLSLGIPLVIWLCALLLRVVSQRIYRAFLALVFGLLAGAVVVQLLKPVESLSVAQNIGIAVGVAFIVVFAYLRWQLVSRFLTVLSPVALLFPALFLFYSPVNKVLFGTESHVLGPEIDSTTPVVLVVFDELPTPSLMAQDRSIDGQSFPNFASLAEHATWYRNATTVAAGSLNAIPAILTGRYPVHTYIPNAVDYPENVFSLLGRSYGIYAHEPITSLCTQYLCSQPPPVGLAEGLRSLGQDLSVVYAHLLLPNEYTSQLPPIDENWMGFTTETPEFQPVTVDKARKTGAEIVHAIKAQSRDRVIKASGQDYGAVFEASLGDLVEQPGSFLYFQHVQLPHVPWRYLPSGKRYKETFVYGKEGRDQWVNEQPWLMAHGFQRHLLQVKYVDVLLGKLLDTLREAGTYDDALIIVTADHGASFKMGAKRRSTTRENMPEIAGVPLLVKLPGQRQDQVSDRFVETVDIVPTIADVLGVKSPWPMDGFSLLSEQAPPNRRITLRSIYGQPMSIENSALREREWILDFKRQWFGTHEKLEKSLSPGNGIKNIFAMGPGKQFLGRAAASLNATPMPSVQASLVRPVQYEKVYLTSPFVPARVTGKLHFNNAEIRNNQTVLIAVNGVIHGSGQTFTEAGVSGRFSVMVPSAPFVGGANTIGVYLLGENAQGGVLFRQIALREPED